MKIWMPILIGMGLCLLVTFENCSGGFQAANFNTATSGSLTSASSGGTTTTAPTVNVNGTNLPDANILPLCTGSCGFSTTSVNQTFVSVTLCVPGTATCQTINNIALDTNSVGLRVFSSVLNSISLPAVTDVQNNPIAECGQVSVNPGVLFGPVKSADVVLGGEPAVNVPIQLIDSAYSNGEGSSLCGAALVSTPSAFGANGVLGIGFLPTDCSNGQCTTNTNYGSCPNNICAQGEVVDLNLQVANPIYFLDQDSNGFSLQLGPISTSNPNSVVGTLTLGISTRANNAPGTVTTLPAGKDASSAAYGSVTSSLSGGAANPAYFAIASPSDAIPASTSAPTCTGANLSTYLCPTQELSLPLVLGSAGTTVSVQLPVGNASHEISSSSTSSSAGSVFNDLTSSSSAALILGTPFFFGRTLYFGMDSQTSVLGTGPYVAF